MRRILVIGIAAALLLGILVATATATVEKTVDVDDSPMTIPSSKLGDEVVYAWFFESKTAEASASSDGGSANAASSSAAASPVFVEVTRVESLGKGVDRQNRVQDVVVVRSNSTSEGYSGTSVSHVELAQRSVIRIDHKFELASTMAASIFYTPGGEPFFPYQSETFHLGEDVTPSDEGTGCYAIGLGWGSGGGTAGIAGVNVGGHRMFGMNVQESACLDDEFSPKVLSSRRWVAQRGTVDGHDAYGIRTETVLRTSDVEDVTFDESTHEFHFTRGPEYELRIVDDTWVSGDLPYVLLSESVYHRDGEESGRAQMVLQSYEPGDVAVPWTDASLPPVPTLERATSEELVGGQGSSIPYPLAQALSDATGAAAPLQYRAWSQTHPDAKLVAARLMIGENSRSAQPSLMWSLFFAEPNGEAHEVATERIRGVSQPLVTDRGDKTIAAFDPAIMPSGLVTLAEIERTWRVLAPETYVSRGVNYVSWGMEIDSTEGLTCLGSGSTSSGVTAEQALRIVYLGWASEGSCAEFPDAIDASVIAYKAESGEVLALLEYHDDFDFAAGPVTPRRVEVETQSLGDGLTIAKPNVAVATVTSSSLLAIFLVAYFLPAIKVVGAQALLLVPGYAKLRKDAILDNKIRDQILDHVKQDPGASITNLAKKVDAGWGTVVYHLGVLEKNKMVSTVLDGRHRRVFPVGLVDFSNQGQLALLKNERVRALYDLIHEQPGAFQDQLAKRIGISAPATSWHLKRLEDAGLVGRVKDGRRVHYFANDAPKAHDQDGMEVA